MQLLPDVIVVVGSFETLIATLQDGVGSNKCIQVKKWHAKAWY